MTNRTHFEDALRYIAYGESEQREKYLSESGWVVADVPIETDGFVDPMTGDVHEANAAYLIARVREVLTILEAEDA